MVIASEKTFPDEVLHLCDSCTSLEMRSQERLRNIFFSRPLPSNVRENATVLWQTTRDTDPIGRHDRTGHGYAPWNAPRHSQLPREFQIEPTKELYRRGYLYHP